MNYTGSHASNYVTAPPSTSAASPPVLPDRREVRPLAAANHSSGGSGTAGSMTQKQAHTANLEAQVRMLEQEVHLLRDGLAQNERLRAVSPSKRVHFGPSSVVAIPPSSSSAAVAQRRASASSSTRPAAGQPSPSERQATLYGQDGRPRLAFGQRVDPSRPRHSSTTRTVKPTGADTSHHVSAAAAVLSGAPPAHTLSSTTVSSTAGYDGRATLPPAVPSTARGSNTSGIPLQGAAAGATVVAALEAGGVPSAAAAAAPPATVWASANPALLWTRAASMADANSGSRGAGGAELIASYPFRTPAAEAATPPTVKVPPAATTAATVGVVPPATATATATAAAAPSSSPIVVTMSSEGWPGGVVASRVVPAGPPDSLSPSAATAALPPSPPAAAAPTPGPAPAGAATAAASIPVTPAASAAMPPAAEVTVSTHANPAQPAPSPAPTPIAPDTTVGELRHQIALLRDTLEQREALLHRVLMELHSRPDATRTPAGAASRADMRRPSLDGERDEHNRRTLRLLTQELLAAQTQLSHARVSYQLLFDEIQRRPAVPPQQPAASAAVRDAPAPPAPTPVPPPAPVPVVPPPAPPTPDVQAKLEAALKKVAAWEDWYATTHRDDENKEREEEAAGAAPDTAAPASAAVESEKTQTNAKKKKKKHHATHGNNEETNGAGYSGFYPSCIGSPPSANMPGLHAAAPLHRGSCGPYQSAYAVDDLLYNQLASNSYAGAALHPSASAAAAASGGAGNRRQERQPSAATAGTAAPPPKATSPASRGQPSTPPQQQQQLEASPLYKDAMSALAPVPSNLCDDLDHARLQAYRDQQYMAQFARGAAVRELAEAERRVAEERLALYRERERHATPPPAAAGTTATPPAASAGRREDAAEGCVPKTQETVDDK